jgi:hypothetical protein
MNLCYVIESTVYKFRHRRYTKASACIAVLHPSLHKDCNLIALLLFSNRFITKQSRLHRATNYSGMLEGERNFECLKLSTNTNLFRLIHNWNTKCYRNGAGPVKVRSIKYLRYSLWVSLYWVRSVHHTRRFGGTCCLEIQSDWILFKWCLADIFPSSRHSSSLQVKQHVP